MNYRMRTMCINRCLHIFQCMSLKFYLVSRLWTKAHLRHKLVVLICSLRAKSGHHKLTEAVGMEKGKAKSLVWVLLKLVLPAASCTCQVIHWEIIESAEPLLSETDTRVYKSFPPGKCLLFLLECVEFDVQWGYFRPESFCLRHLIYRLPPLPCQPGLFFTLYFGTELPEVTLWRQQSVRSLGITQPLEDFAAQRNICGDHKVDILSPSSCSPPCSTSPIWLALSQRDTRHNDASRTIAVTRTINNGRPARHDKKKKKEKDEMVRRVDRWCGETVSYVRCH